MSKQLTSEQAIALYDSGAWKKWTPQELAAFQMEQDCLAVPFGEFQKAMEIVLGRPVWTHEFADRERLRAEMNGAPTPTFDEVLAMLPADKVILVIPPDGQ
jgi:hypothetical protein